MKKTYVKPNTNTLAVEAAQLMAGSGSSLSTPEGQNNAPRLKILVEEDDNSMAGGSVSNDSNAKPYDDWDAFDED